MQPLLAAGVLPGLQAQRGRLAHRALGGLLVLTVALHVGGLWVTSPLDVVDALTFASPTPFSVWGVTAMWAVLATALLAHFRRRLRLGAWRISHTALATVIVVGSVVHALLIEGTMETAWKAALCMLTLAASLKAATGLRPHARRPAWGATSPRS